MASSWLALVLLILLLEPLPLLSVHQHRTSPGRRVRPGGRRIEKVNKEFRNRRKPPPADERRPYIIEREDLLEENIKRWEAYNDLIELLKERPKPKKSGVGRIKMYK